MAIRVVPDPDAAALLAACEEIELAGEVLQVVPPTQVPHHAGWIIVYRAKPARAARAPKGETRA